MTVSAADFRACMERVHEKLSVNVPRLNNGGCGFFAAELGKRMLDAGITDFGIVVFDDESYCNVSELETELREYGVDIEDINNWSDNGLLFGHVAVEYDGAFWDGHESFTDTIYKEMFDLVDGELSLEAIVALGQSHQWNPTYDRSNDEYVKKVLDECFECLV